MSKKNKNIDSTNVISTNIYEFGNKQVKQILKIKLPEILISKLNNYTIEIVDYSSVISKDVKMLFLVDKKDNVDIKSYKLNVNDNTAFKRIFEQIDKDISNIPISTNVQQISG